MRFYLSYLILLSLQCSDLGTDRQIDRQCVENNSILFEIYNFKKWSKSPKFAEIFDFFFPPHSTSVCCIAMGIKYIYK